MLSVMALAAFLSDAGAQTRRSSGENKSSAERKSGSTVTRQAPPKRQNPPHAVKPEVKPDNKGNKPADKPNVKPNGKHDNKPGKPGVKPGDRPGDRPDHRPDHRPGDKPGHGPEMRPGDRPGHRPDHRPDHRHDRPRVHPRDRDFMSWDRPSHHWSHNDHYYGYKVRSLPARAHRHVIHGVVYYCYNDIWYRPYGRYYVVCRPPHGLALAADIISDIAWTAVRLSYYNTVANAYSTINENNAYIAEQNEIIAKNQQLARTSYTLANELGLVQSYAAPDSEYFYQDGVFYAKDASGEYKVILPPAGALVEALPENFDTVTLRDGNEYYKVEDTIFKVSVLDGKPYFEVVGQQYS